MKMKWVLFFVGLSLALPTAGSAALGPSNELRLFVEQMAAVQSVAVEATAVVSMEGGEKPVTGKGTFRYWDDGERYRVQCSTESALQANGETSLLQDADFLFDGEVYHYWDREMNYLSRNRTGGPVPIALPNPFFAVLDFLRPDPPDCPGCHFALAEYAALDFSSIPLQPEGDHGYTVTESVFGPSPVDVDVVMSGEEPTVIRQISRKVGSGQTTYEFTQWEPTESEGLMFPRSISMVHRLADGSVPMRIDFLVTSLEINGSNAPGTFTLQPDSETRVWDGDREQYEQNALPGQGE